MVSIAELEMGLEILEDRKEQLLKRNNPDSLRLEILEHNIREQKKDIKKAKQGEDL